MTKMNLCSACDRHVYADEPACPFCGSTAPRLPAAEPVARGRLSRAASHAARAAIFAGALGCGTAHPPDAGGDAAVADAAARADAGTAEDAATDAGTDAAVADASTPDDAAVDAGEGIPLYGGVFPDPRKRAVV